MWITPLQMLPERTRLGATLGVAVITAVVPMAILLLMLKAGRISDMSVSVRRERRVPMLIGAVSYLCAAVYLGVLHGPVWLRAFFFGAATATLIAMVVTFAWKISAHAIAMGGMAGMMLWLAFAGLATVDSLFWLSLVIVLGGMVGSSRLILGRHTPTQVFAGWLLGGVCVFAFMWMAY